MIEIQIVNIRCTIFSLEKRYFSCCLLHFIKQQLFRYIFIYLFVENKDTKNREKKERRKEKKIRY